MQMTFHLARMVAEIRAGTPPATEHLERPELVDLAVRLFREARVRGVLSVLNRVPDSDAEPYLRDALEAEGVPVGGVIGEDPTIQVQWLHGRRLGSDYLSEAAALLARSLEAVARKAPAASAAGVSEPPLEVWQSSELRGRA